MSSSTPPTPSECSDLVLKIKDIHLEPEQRSKLSRFYITLFVGGKERRTAKAKSTKWSDLLEIVGVSPSTPIYIQVSKVKLGSTKSLGYFHGIVKDLINESGSDVSIFLDNQGKNRLLMSVMHDRNTNKATDSSGSATEVAKKALDAAGNLSSGSASAAIESMVATANSAQQIAEMAFNAAKSLPETSVVGETLRRIGTFVDIVDGFAEIHPYINAAWLILSSVYKVWQTHVQQVQSIRDLAESLRNMLDFVELGKDIQELENGMDIIADMWEAIKDAAGIIEEFCKSSSSVGKGVREAIRKKVEEDIENTRKRFSQLRADLDSVVGFQALKKIQQVANVVEISHTEELSKVERELIDRLPSARILKAEYDRVDPALKGTRTKLLETLYEELTDTNPGTPRIIWVNGLAGTGKSTISATIARTLKDHNILAGNFFFSRSEKDRSNPEIILPALARQFASFPPLRASIVKALKDNDTDIASSQLATQFSELIEKPLRVLKTHKSPVVLVVDALDECISPEHFLRIIEAHNSRLPSCLKIFLTSRPENPITSAMQRMGGAVREHPLRQSDTDIEDVRLAFEDNFSIIRGEYGLEDDWPGKDQLDRLVEKAKGLFIWMSTVCKFIMELDPLGRLDLTLGITTDESDNPFAALDELYLRVLQQASPKGHSKNVQRLRLLFQNTVGTLVTAKIALSELELIQILGMQRDEFRATIKGLRALLDIPKEPVEPIQILHPSFVDFVTHRERCKDDRLFIESDHHHQKLALRCLQIMNNGLKENICGIDFTLFNSEIENLSSLVSQYIPKALQYACRFWADHLEHSGPDPEIESSLRTFYEVHFLHWLEVLSLLYRFDSAHSSLVTGQKWLQKHLSGNRDETFNTLVDDCRRFVMGFREPISKSALHVYHSALPFTGKETQLYKTYSKRCESNISVSGIGVETWSSCLAVLEGHTKSVRSALFSPDGMRIMSRSDDDTLRLWDGLTGAPIGDAMYGHSDRVRSATFSPDGMRIVSCSDDGTLRLWDGLTGVPIGGAMHGHSATISSATFSSGHSSLVWSATFSSDGMRIVSCSDDGTLRLWDGLTGAPIGDAMYGHSDRVHSATFSPDGMRIVSCSDDGTLQLWDGLTGTPIADAMRGHSVVVHSATFSPDGMRIASCSDDGTLRLWDGLTGAPIGDAMYGHSDRVHSATFSPDGMRIASCSDDGTLRLWDGLTGAPIADAVCSHSDGVLSATFSPDGMRIVSCSYNRTLQLWDGLIGAPIGDAMYGHSDWVRSVTFSPDGMRITSSSNDRTLRLWDGLMGAPIGDAMYGHSGPVHSATFSPDGMRIVSSSSDRTLRLWDGLTGAPIADAMCGHSVVVYSATFSPDGMRIVSCSYNRTLQLWDGLTGAPIGDAMYSHSGPVHSATFSPDGMRIVSCSNDGTLRLWDGLTGAPIGGAMYGHSGLVRSATFSPDGMRIVSCSNDGTLRLWDGLTGAPIGDTMYGHSDWVRSVTFSPDGMRIVSCSYNRTLQLWDGLTGAPIRDAMYGHSSSVWSATFSPDGMRIVSCSDDGTLRLWDGLTGARIGDAMHGHSDRVLSAMFSSDGMRIVSCSDDRTVRVWDGLTGVPIGGVMHGHSATISSATFSPNGKHIISTTTTGELLSWDVDHQKRISPPPGTLGTINFLPSSVWFNNGWVYLPGANKKLWWMPVLNRRLECTMPDGRLFISSSAHSIVTFVDGRKALKLSLK